jgi:hypothetical protein
VAYSFSQADLLDHNPDPAAIQPAIKKTVRHENHEACDRKYTSPKLVPKRTIHSAIVFPISTTRIL